MYLILQMIPCTYNLPVPRHGLRLHFIFPHIIANDTVQAQMDSSWSPIDDKRLRKIADEVLEANKVVFDRLAEI